MDLARDKLVSVDEFFAWLVHQEGQYELVNGQIRMMTGATNRHNEIKNNVTVALTPAARRCGCRSTTSDSGVQTGARGVRYPDVVVDCGPQSPTAMTVSNPVIVVEVSSPSTRGTDLGIKLVEYQSLDSVQIIIQIEPDEIYVAVQRRVPGSAWQVEIHQDLEATIELSPLNTALAVSDIYFGLSVKPRPTLQVVEK